MFRSSLRHVRFVASPVTVKLGAPTRRFLSTGSNATKKSTWKGTALRWGTAGAAVYIYNTSPIFQDVPMPQAVTPPKHFDEADNLTIDAIIESRRKQIQEDKAAKAAAQKAEAVAQVPMSSEATQTAVADGSPEAQASGAESQGAYNPETGEINWDCPCLGGMAYGPCGEEFKAAFSCFVYSEAEPKGMDCIEKFQGMQNCFREHPDVYAAELDEDDAPPATSAEDAAKPAQLEATLAQGEKKEETSKVIEDKKDEVKKADKPKKEFKTEQTKQGVKEVAQGVKETMKSEVSAKAEEIKEAKPKKASKAAKVEEKTEKVENTKTA